MRRTVLVFLLLLGLLVSSCESGGDYNSSNSKALPSNLKQQEVKVINNIELCCIVGEPTAKLTGLYVVNGLNTTGSNLKDVTAHLFLLNSQKGDFLRLSEKIENINVDEKIHIEWSLSSSSSIGIYWQKNQLTHLSAHDRAYYGFKPDILIFLSTSEGVYEIDSKKVTYYFPLTDGNYEETERSLVDGSGREGFKMHNVELPGE
jgi:hypothetical protein